MEREKLLQEQKATLESLVEKTRFVYSDEFYKLDEFDKQKYTKDKMATETHLGTLSNILWGEKIPQFGGSLTDMFALGILSSMFGTPWSSSSSTTTGFENKSIEEQDKEKVYAIPTK